MCQTSVFVRGGPTAAPELETITSFRVHVSSRVGSANVELSISLPEAGEVRLDVFDVRGRRVRTLVDRTLPTGVHRIPWNGTDSNGTPLASGVYYYRASYGSAVANGSVVLLR